MTTRLHTNKASKDMPEAQKEVDISAQGASRGGHDQTRKIRKQQPLT